MKIVAYIYLILTIIWYIFTFAKDKKKTKKAIKISINNFLTRIVDIFAIFLLLGVINQFVPKDLVFRFLGNGKSIWNNLIALFAQKFRR